MNTELLRIITFAIIGVWNTIFDLGLFWVYINTIGKLNFWKKFAINTATISHILSFLCANLVSFVLNSQFTFRDTGTNRGFFPYFLVTGVGLAVSTIIIQHLTQDKFYNYFINNIYSHPTFSTKTKSIISMSPKKYALLIKLAMVAVIMTVNYIGYKYFVF